MATTTREVVVAVEWGDEMHTCPMALRTWRSVLKGSRVIRVEPYWYEGERFVGRWHFNPNGPGTLLVEYDDGGVGFDGDLSDALITVAGQPTPWNG